MPTFTPTSGGNEPDLSIIRGNPRGTLAELEKQKGHASRLTFLNDALRRFGEPASALSYLIQGDLKGAGGSLADIVLPHERTRTIGLSDVPILRQATGQLPWYLRGPARFGLDVAGDPLTYLTFGASSVGRKAGMAAAERLAVDALKAGRAPTITERAMASARAAEEIYPTLGRGVTIGARIPFTRNASIDLARVNIPSLKDRLPKSAQRYLDTMSADGSALQNLRAGTRKSLLPSRGVDRKTNFVLQSIRRAAAAETTEFTKAADDLARDIYTRARDIRTSGGEKITAKELSDQITRHLDDPDRVALPPMAQDLAARARQLLDDIGGRELMDGIERGAVSNYVPHMMADRASLQRFRDSNPNLGAASADHPFFVHERARPDLRISDVERGGYKLETDISTLIKARASASANARIKRVSEKMIAARGVKAVEDVPDVARLAPEDVARTPLVQAADREVRTLEAAARTLANLPGAAQQRRVINARLVTAKKRAAAARETAANTANSKAAAKAEKIIAANEKALARPGRVVSKAELQRLGQKGWAEIDHSHSYLTGILLSKEDREILARVHDMIGDSMRDPNAAQRFIQRLGSSWKRMALATPGFHIRNMYDDGIRSWFAGARNPYSFVQAHRILTGSEGAINLGKGRRMTAQELRDAARDWGVTDLGYVRNDVMAFEQQSAKTAFLRHGAGRRVNLLRGMEQIGEYRENVFRMNLFLERLKAGDSIPVAAKTTRDFLFDYGEVGVMVDVGRRYWMPFITYTSKVIPSTIKTFAQNPRIPAHIGMLMDTANETAIEEGANPDLSQLPAGMESSVLLPPALSGPLQAALGGRSGVPDAEAPTLMVNPEGIAGFTQLNLLDPRNWKGRIVGGMVNPFLIKPIEAMTDYSFYYNRGQREGALANANLVHKWLNRIPGDLPGVDLFGMKKDSITKEPRLGVSMEFATLLGLLPPVGQVSSALAPLDDGGAGSNLGAARYWGGLPVTSFDRAREAYWAARNKE